MRIAALLALPGLIAAMPAMAQSSGELYKPLPGIEYYCRDSNGDRREVGELLCITASCQTWMARCEMSRTNTFTQWRKIQDGCPGVDASTPQERIEALKNTL